MLREMRIAGVGLACALGFCTASFADQDGEKPLNLWISHHFAGLENYYTGDYNDAAHLYEAAAIEADKKYHSADTENGLGRAATALGKFSDAEAHYRNALELKRESLGKNHPFLASTLNDLADVLYLEEKKEECEGLYRQALDLLERDQFNLEVARSLNGLALLKHDAGDDVAAEEMLKRALAIDSKGQRRDHPYTATVLTNLGILYTHLGRNAEAEQAFTRAKYIQDVKLRPGHPDVAVREHASAVLLHNMGQAGEAARLAADAEAIRAAQSAKGDLY